MLSGRWFCQRSVDVQKPADYDFVTDRKPEQIVSAALRPVESLEARRAFGIIIVIGKEKFEVVTMRTEGYEDPHCPETVVFVKDIFRIWPP